MGRPVSQTSDADQLIYFHGCVQEVLSLMKHHGKEKYVHGKFEIKVVAKDETIRVKVAKEDSGDE